MPATAAPTRVDIESMYQRSAIHYLCQSLRQACEKCKSVLTQRHDADEDAVQEEVPGVKGVAAQQWFGSRMLSKTQQWQSMK